MAGRNRTTFRFTDIRFATPDTMREIGNRVSVAIVNRTMSGKDEDGKRFVPYSKAYRKRKPTYGGGDVVDLHLSGDMLADIGPTEVTDRRVRVGFTDPDLKERASYHEDGRGHMPVRRFMGITSRMVREIVQYLRERMRL